MNPLEAQPKLWRLLATPLIPLLLSITFAAPPPPANDDYINAIDLGSAPLPILIGTTLGATPGPKEPYSSNILPPIIQPAVWFKWTSTAVGNITFIGDAGYPNVWAYSSTGGMPDILVAHDNATFVSVPGTTYYFAVATAAFTGDFRVRIITSAPPANDSFANAIALSPASDRVEVVGSAEGSTLEPDEPNPFSPVLGSIWYKWTPPVSGRLHYSHFQLQIFRPTGPSIKDLSLIATSSDRPNVVAGNTYYLAVYGTDPVDFWIDIAQNPPSNDSRDTATPIQLSNGAVTIEGTTVGANPDSSDVYAFDPTGADTVWYKWTPDSSGSVVATISSEQSGIVWPQISFQVLRVRDNPFFLFPIASPGQTFGVNAGETYFFKVFGWVTVDAPFQLTITRASAPPNDNFASAAPLTSFAGITTVGSTLEPNEPHLPGAVGSVWYTISAPAVMRLVDLAPDPNTTWTLYSGHSLETLQKVDPPELIAGETYYLNFTTTAANGTTFDFQGAFFPVTGNPNDFFDQAITITGPTNLLVANSPETASIEPGESVTLPNRGINGTLWWKYVAPASGWLLMSPASDAIYCTLYSGSSLNSLTALNTGLSLTAVQAGQIYYVQVRQDSLIQANVQLTFSQGSENDRFDQAIALDPSRDGSTLHIIGQTGNATAEPGEPLAANGAGHTVWYRWIAPFDGDLFATKWDNSPGILVAYKGSSLDSLQPLSTNYLNIPVSSGETYYFQVDDTSAAAGAFALDVSATAYSLNDNFADALDLDYARFGPVVNGYGYMNRATLESGEPSHMSVPHKSLWWKYRAGASGASVQFNASAIGGGLMAFDIYRGGADFASLTLIASDEGTDLNLLGPLDLDPFEQIYIALAVPVDSQNNVTFQASLSFAPSSQSIHLDAIPTQDFGAGPIQLNGSADSNLPVQYSLLRGPATLQGNVLTITGAGIVSIKASQPGNDIYPPAPDVVYTFGVRKRSQTISFAPVNVTSNPVSLSATSSADLPVQFDITSGPASLEGNMLVNVGEGPITVRATQNGDSNTRPAEPVEQIFVISKYPQKISVETGPVVEVASGASVNRLQSLSQGSLDRRVEVFAAADSGLPVSLTVLSGSATFNGQFLTLTGPGAVTIRATQPGSELYLPASVDQTFPALPTSPQTITFAPIADVPVGTASLPLQATASSGLPVIFSVVSGNASVIGPSLFISGAGQITVRASQPGNDQFDSAPDVDRSFQVTKLAQTITWPSLPSLYVGNTPLILGATASSGLPVTFQLLSGPANLDGKSLSATGAGAVLLRAIQSGDSTYLPTTADYPINALVKSGQSIQFDALPDVTVNTASITLIATAGSGLPITFTLISGNATLSGNLLTISGAGSITVRASQPGSYEFEAAPAIERTFNVKKLVQTLAISDLPSLHVGDPPVKLTATASSGLPVTFQILSGPAELSGDLLWVTGFGTLSIRVTQAGDSTYEAATLDRQFMVVAELAQTIQFDSLPDVPVGTSSLELNATASSGLPVTLTLVSGNATLNAKTITIGGPGLITLRASQSGNDQFDAAPDVERTFEVTRLSQTVSLAPLPPLHFGDSPVQLSASASSALPVTFQLVSGPAELSGLTLKITGAGALTLRVTQSGNDTFLPAPDLTTTLTISKAPQTIAFPGPSEPLKYDGRFQLSASASSGLPVTFLVLSGPGEINDENVLYVNNIGDILVEASQPGDSNFEPALVTRTLPVGKSPEISVDLSQGTLLLSWPDAFVNFQIEASATLDGDWLPIARPDPASTTFEMPIQTDSRFFRLKSLAQ